MRYSVFISDNENIDQVVVLLEMKEGNEVIHVNRMLDYILVNSNNPRTLWVPGVSNVSEDLDIS